MFAAAAANKSERGSDNWLAGMALVSCLKRMNRTQNKARAQHLMKYAPMAKM